MSGVRLRSSFGPFEANRVAHGDCLALIGDLPPDSIDVAITSPPYWGQRLSDGMGTEPDPREYLAFLREVFVRLLPKLKPDGLLWINLGDAYNTPVNWRLDDRKFSTLGANKNGLADHNSAYIKPRSKRKAYTDKNVPWLTYGNLLALPYRLVIDLSDGGYLFRGEIIWKKKNAMPEGRCRRPHRQHESIYLFARAESHQFCSAPPVPSVWEFANEKIDGKAHFSRFPTELPVRCINAYGLSGPEVVVLDPFSGSGTTGIAARRLDCTYIGFEIDEEQVSASNERISRTSREDSLFGSKALPFR